MIDASSEHGLFLPHIAKESPSQPTHAIHYEPGMHLNKDALSNTFALLMQGNTESFMWNDEVGQRIGRYSPGLISIDGLSPIGIGELSDSQKLLIWLSLPDRPADINPISNRVFLLAGDSLFYSDVVANLISPQDPKYRDTLAQLDESTYKDHKKEAGPIYLDAEILFGAGFLGYAMSDLSTRSETGRNFVPQKKMNRRKFLSLLAKGSLASGAALTLGRFAGTKFLAQASNAHQVDLGTQLITFIQPRLTATDLIDGRTALLYAKTRDAYAALGMTPDEHSSMIMGTGHSFKITEIAQNPQLRADMIRKYAKNFYRVIHEFVNKHPKTPHIDDKQLIRDYLSEGTIISVSDPDTEPGSVRGNLTSLRKSIQKYMTFHSDEIITALTPFPA